MYLIAFEIDSVEAVKELNTEHGWKSWNWSTAVRLIRDYFAGCVETARPGISPKIEFEFYTLTSRSIGGLKMVSQVFSV